MVKLIIIVMTMWDAEMVDNRTLVCQSCIKVTG